MCGHPRKHHDFGKPGRCWKCGCGMFYRRLTSVAADAVSLTTGSDTAQPDPTARTGSTAEHHR